MRKNSNILVLIMALILTCAFLFRGMADAAYWSSALLPQMVATGQQGKEDNPKIIFLVVDNNQNSGKRLEGLMLAALELKTRKVQITSIPKNMHLNIKDKGYLTLDQIYRQYGLNNIIRLAKQCFNASDAHFIMVNLQNGAKIIDKLGGVEVDAPHPLEGYEAGRQKMNGSQLVSYSLKNDPKESRQEWEKRQMAIIKAVVSAGLHPRTILKLPAIIQQMVHSLQTDFKLTELIGLAVKIRGIEFSKVRIEIAPGQNKQANDKYIWVLDRNRLTKLISRAS